jgi:hypothetical protein
LANPERRWRRLAVLKGQEAEAAALIAAARAERRGDGEQSASLTAMCLPRRCPMARCISGLALEVSRWCR